MTAKEGGEVEQETSKPPFTSFRPGKKKKGGNLVISKKAQRWGNHPLSQTISRERRKGKKGLMGDFV